MPLNVGDVFPAASLPDLDGRARPLAEAWAGGEALIAIGHRDCGTTRMALPYVDRIHRRRAAGTTVVAVLQDSAEGARGLRSELDLDLPLRLEPDPYTLAAALRVAVVPTLFVVGRDGRILEVCEAFRKPELEAIAARFGALPLFDAGDPTPAFKPG